MNDRALSPDTQAVLLLCGELGRSAFDVRPLGPKQYSALASWLDGEGLRPSDLLSREGCDRLKAAPQAEIAWPRVEPLLERGANLGFAAERWERAGIWVLSRADAAYPGRLADYLGAAAPPLLYGIGERKTVGRGGLAVVGSRDRSGDDAEFARRIGEQCARENITVISGAAKGIDRDAMTGAIEGGGTALGVLAEGVFKSATSPDLREPIANGNVTLLSPYDPDARWFTHTAMDRNKLLYALSDAALVVSSGEETGGTWAGATEALKAGRVRVYVRIGAGVPTGNRRLVQAGALPFPPEAWANLAALFDAPPPEPEPPPASPDAYTLILPELMKALQSQQSDKMLAERFKVRLPQMKDWLARAMEEGRIKKTKKPSAGYVVQDAHSELRDAGTLPLFADQSLL